MKEKYKKNEEHSHARWSENRQRNTQQESILS